MTCARNSVWMVAWQSCCTCTVAVLLVLLAGVPACASEALPSLIALEPHSAVAGDAVLAEFAAADVGAGAPGNYDVQLRLGPGWCTSGTAQPSDGRWINCTTPGDVPPGLYNASIIGSSLQMGGLPPPSQSAIWRYPIPGSPKLTERYTPYTMAPDGQPYMFQYMPSISSISPSHGSAAGGTFITIMGSSFIPTNASAVNVDIAGAPCIVQAVTPTMIACQTCPLSAEAPGSSASNSSTNSGSSSLAPSALDTSQTTAIFAGNRGVHQQRWYGNTASFVPVLVPPDRPPDEVIVASSFASALSQEQDYFQQLTALFVPPFTGQYTFFVSADDWADVYISTELDPTNQTLLLSTRSPCPGFFCNTLQQAATLALEGNQHYLLDGRHWQWRGTGHFSLAVFAQRDAVGLQPPLRGNETAVPHWFLAPIPSDYLSTPHLSPQVRVTINGIGSICRAAAGDCSFTPSAASTPVVTGLRISDALETGARSLVISGSGFATRKQNNTVTVADKACIIASCTANLIICWLAPGGMAGRSRLVVAVDGLGWGQHAGPDAPFSVTNPLGLNSSGGHGPASLGGGTAITLTGDGFGVDPNQVAITVGSSNVSAELLSVSPTSLTFTAPANPEPLTATASIVLPAMLTVNTVQAAFEVVYSASATPVAHAVQLSDTSAAEAVSVLIQGMGFSELPEDNVVMMGNQSCTVLQANSTTISCTAEPGTPGLVNITISVAGKGLASGSLAVERYFAVTAMTPMEGSLQGGTIVVLTGRGFPTWPPRPLQVSLLQDGLMACDVIQANATHIICVTRLQPLQPNSASQPSVPACPTASGAAYQVEVTSGRLIASGSGAFSWHTSADLSLQSDPIGALPGDAVAVTWGIDFAAGTGSGNTSSAPASFLSLPANSSAGSWLGGRNLTIKLWPVSAAVGGLPSWQPPCNLPGGAAQQGQPASQLLPPAYADYQALQDCSVQHIRSDEIYCNLPIELQAGQYLLVGWVDNWGFAAGMPLLTVQPSVTAVSPASGSLAGTQLTITGTGFSTADNETSVMVGGQACRVQSVSATSITCRAPPMLTDTSTEVAVTIASKIASGSRPYSCGADSSQPSAGAAPPLLSYNLTAAIPAVASCSCDVASAPGSSAAGNQSSTANSTVLPGPVNCCRLQYDSMLTPVIDALEVSTTPENITEILLRGAGFGMSPADTLVALLDGDANQLASTTASASDQVTASIASLPAGFYDIQAFVVGKGFAVNAANNSIQAHVTLSAVAPTAGSLMGGSPISVTGAGFDAKYPARNRVTVCGAACPLQGAFTNRLSCITGAIPAATGVSNRTCDVVVQVGSMQAVLRGAFLYAADLTPYVTGIQPSFGPSSGGTLLTLTGQGLLPAQPAPAGIGVVDVDYLQVSVRVGGMPCQVLAANQSWAQCQTPARTAAYDSSLGLSVRVARSGLARVDAPPFTYLDRWSDPATWPAGILPQAGDDVVISANQSVLLDMSTPALSSLRMEGNLLVEDAQDLSLQACSISIIGGNASLSIGSASHPFEHQVNITLGSTCGSSKDAGDELAGGLMVDGGRLEMHGRPQVPSWTLLAASAAGSARQMRLVEPVNWQVNDTVIITSTSTEPGQTERLTVTAVANSTVTFTPALQFDHTAQVLDLNGTRVEMRAEVAVLTRNLRVSGPAGPSGSIAKLERGMFVTAQSGASLQLSHVEIANCGQAGLTGHPAVAVASVPEDSNSYITACSIHDSAHEGLTLADAPGFLVQDTVVHGTAGHAFSYLGGTNGTGPILASNLGSCAQASSLNTYTDTTPAVFYMRAAGVQLRGNVAASSTAHGFWFDLPVEQHHGSWQPALPAHTLFDSNVAHSGGSDGLRIATRQAAAAPMLLSNFTAFGNQGAGVRVGSNSSCMLVSSALVGNMGGGVALDLVSDTDASTLQTDAVWVVPDLTSTAGHSGVMAASPEARFLSGPVNQTMFLPLILSVSPPFSPDQPAQAANITEQPPSPPYPPAPTPPLALQSPGPPPMTPSAPFPPSDTTTTTSASPGSAPPAPPISPTLFSLAPPSPPPPALQDPSTGNVQPAAPPPSPFLSSMPPAAGQFATQLLLGGQTGTAGNPAVVTEPTFTLTARFSFPASAPSSTNLATPANTSAVAGPDVLLAQPPASSIITLVSSPANLPVTLQLLGQPNPTVQQPGAYEFSVSQDLTSAAWRGICQLPISLALYIPDGVVADASAARNAASNVLYISWYPPLSPACQGSPAPPSSPAPVGSAGTLVFSMMLPDLDIARFQDASFKSAFLNSYTAQVAKAAGVPATAVTVLSISAGSVAVQTQVTYPQTSQAALALQIFQQALVTNPGQIFTDPQFSGAYGRPQAAILAVTAPPPPSPPPPPVPAQQPPLVSPMQAPAPASGLGPIPAVSVLAPTAQHAVHHPFPLVGIVLVAILGGITLLTLACVAALWRVRKRQKRLQDAQEEAEMAAAAQASAQQGPETAQNLRARLRASSRKVWNRMTARFESPRAGATGAQTAFMPAIPEKADESPTSESSRQSSPVEVAVFA